MTKEKMTIHKALTELSIIDDRIEDAIVKINPVLAKKHSVAKVNGIEMTDFDAEVKSVYQKATDLIKRREAIKRAVVKSNAKTVVKIGDEEYTVAEAIDMKNHGIEYEERLMRRLTDCYDYCAQRVLENNASELEARADAFITSIYGNKDNAKTAEAVKAREDFIESNAYEIHDPLGVQKIISELDEKIDTFRTDVDSALSVSNALTEIEIEY